MNKDNLITTIKSLKLAVSSVAVTLFVMLIVIVGFFSQKTIVADGTGDIGAATRGISLKNGSYEMSLNYEATEDSVLEMYYEGNGQELILGRIILSAGENVGSYVINVPISIRNGSVHARVIGENCLVTSGIRLKKVGFPMADIMALVFYAAFGIFSIAWALKSNETETGVVSPSCLVAFLSLLSLFMIPVFEANKIVIPVWFVLLALLLMYVRKGKITITKNAARAGILLLFAFVVLEFFTTSSPLFAVNFGCDSNAYYSVGAALAHGRDMYTEVFDHKGPILLFVFMVGYLITPYSFLGVWLLEIIALTASMVFTDLIAQKFVSKKISMIIAMASSLLILNDDYLTTGATVEEFMIPLLLYLFYIMLYHEKYEKPTEMFVILGILSSVIFYSKFSVFVAWTVVSFVLWITYYRKNWLSTAIAYVCGWLVTTVPIVIYFVCTGGIKGFYRYYIKFNMEYGAVSTLMETIVRIANNVYDALLENKTITCIIVIGIVMIWCSVGKINLLQKILIPVSFIVLCGTIYAGTWSFNYYFTLVAIYGVFGFIGIGVIIEKLLGNHSEENLYKTILASAVIIIGVLFMNNELIKKSMLLDREPCVQEVMAQQMNFNLQGENYSFYELGMLDFGFYAMAHKYPMVQFFYMPNIDPEINNEPYTCQVEYAGNKATDYIIWKGFSEDNYPGLEAVNNNYEHVMTFMEKDSVFYMLYKKRAL